MLGGNQEQAGALDGLSEREVIRSASWDRKGRKIRGQLGPEGEVMDELAAGPNDNIRRVNVVAVNESSPVELHGASGIPRS